MDAMPYYHECARNAALHDHVCAPCPVTKKLIEWEHACYYKGQKVNEIWAMIPICWYVHRGPGMVKEINEWLALNRATTADFAKYPKNSWAQRKRYLNTKYGLPKLSTTKAPF